MGGAVPCGPERTLTLFAGDLSTAGEARPGSRSNVATGARRRGSSPDGRSTCLLMAVSLHSPVAKVAPRSRPEEQPARAQDQQTGTANAQSGGRGKSRVRGPTGDCERKALRREAEPRPLGYCDRLKSTGRHSLGDFARGGPRKWTLGDLLHEGHRGQGRDAGTIPRVFAPNQVDDARTKVPNHGSRPVARSGYHERALKPEEPGTGSYQLSSLKASTRQ
jgi:hypothetical protein